MAQTLDQMAQLVCGKVGQVDAGSVALCYGFLNYRFRMIFDSFPWRDSQIIPSDVNTVASQAYVLLPSGVDRVISIRCNGQMLDPTNSTIQIETNPTYFDTTGVPLYYEEYTEVSDSSKRIRLFPIPNAVFALKIVAKRTPNTLSASGDTPILRNIDNVLIAYAMGDMLERQRQYGKSGEKFKEAGALLEAAKQLENNQTNAPRTTKTTSVTGDSLAEMRDAVCAKTGMWDQQARLLADEFLRRNYQRIYDAYLWPESKVIYTASSTGAHIVLPDHIAQVIKVRYSATLPAIDVADLSAYFDLVPGIFEETATQPAAYSVLTPIGSSILPPTGEKLQVVSSSAADKGNVFIRGEQTNGAEFSETVVLNGTTNVAMASALLVPLTISKGITAGTITVTGFSSGTLYQTLLPTEREKKHIRLWIQPNTGVAASCLVLGKRKIRPLQTDEDTPMIRGIGYALICSASADLLRPKGQSDVVDTYKEDAGRAVQSLINQFTEQAAYSQQVVPWVEPMAWDGADSDAWVVAKI